MASDTEAAIKLEMNRLRGRLAGFIEACGLGEKRERGLVSTMKSLSYETEKAILKQVSDE